MCAILLSGLRKLLSHLRKIVAAKMSPSLTYQHPTSYTAYAILQDGGKLEKIEVKWKYPSAGEIVVKVLACGVCAT